MSTNATVPPAPTIQLDDANHGPWSYNSMARIVTHEANACSTCAGWALHYMLSVIKKDDTLTRAEDQRVSSIRGGLTTEATTLRDINESLRRELVTVREEFEDTRRKLASADDEISRLRDERDGIKHDADKTIRGLRAQIDALEGQLRDLGGRDLRRRKVPRHGATTQPVVPALRHAFKSID